MAANAAHRGDLAQLETFIRKGMSVSDLDHALLLASQQGRGPCAAALCDAGADPLKHTRKAGWGQDGNPLVWAAQRGHREVLEVFFRKLPDGAHTMSRKRVKMKIIDEAVFGCTNLSTIVWLVELHEEALRMQNVYEEIPLHRACKYNAKFEIIKYLVEKTGGGLEESALTAKGESPLDLALEFSPSDEVRSWARRHPRTRLFRMFEVVPGLPASSSDSSTVVKALETASGRFVTVKGTADARQFETELSALLRLADAHIMPLLRVLIPTDYDFIDPLLSPERSEMLRWQEKVPGVRDSCTNTSAPKKKGHYAMREADGRWGQVVYIDRDACRLVWVDKTAKAELNGGSFNFHPSKLGACVTSLEHLLDAEELRKIPVGRLDMSKDLSKWQMEGCKFFLVTASEEDCRDLEREIAVGTFAGRDAARVRKCAHDTAQALHQLERHNMTHGELTTRDVVISSSMLVKLVDLNGAAEHGQPCHLKISTAFGSPQLAERVLRHKQAEPGSEWKEWIQRPENLLLATTTIDIFAFGVILHRMGIPDSPPIFLSTSSNNILEEHDLKILAYRWSEWALLHAGHIAHSGAEWAACADLAFWCMQAEPERRPQSFAEVLAHRFFSESGKLRYLNSIDEPWAALEERLTTKMHLAVEQQRPDELKQLLMDTGADRGAYYAMMQRDVSLLHRIAFHGNTEAAIVALENIDNAWPASVRAELLDIRTQLGYTAYMIACDCGHTEIAELLEAKGCTVGLRNNSGKTGADLLQASQDEYKQSILTPHNHGYKLHLSYDSLESYLAVLERMLDEDVAAGIKLWHAKQAVYHFSREQMAQLEAIVKELLPKSFDIAIHFTDLGSNNLILNTKGIRASVVGQLGGGVSVCLRSLVGFEWGQDWDKFTEAVGKALWGSKWYEVMSGEPWTDLEQKIASGEVKGSWPAARDHWGACSSKLETAFLVAVPSAANRNPARILPGREDVFIIPRSDCTPGFEGDSNVYFSPKNIKACLILKPPSNATELEPQLATLTRVQCSTQYDKKGMNNLRLSPISADATVIDIDEGKQFAPKIKQFTMSIAQPTDAVSVVKDLHHSALQPTFSSQQLWLEDTARFKAEEMAAGIVGVEQLLTQAYTMAYYFTTIESANTICEHGIPTVTDGSTRSLTVCLLPPSAQELGWHSNAGGGFKHRVAALLGMEVDDVQAMVLLGVPTCAIEQAECMGEAVFTLVEPSDGLTFLQKTEGGDVVYSNEHIAKVWTLEATALVDARQALINVRAGEELEDAFADHTADQIEQIVQEHLSKEDTTGVGLVDEGVPPDAAGAQQDDVPSRHRQLVERDEYISELEQQLADVQKELIAQRSLLASHKQTAAATQAQLKSDLRSREEYIGELEAMHDQ